jgi:hypothetical protein
VLSNKNSTLSLNFVVFVSFSHVQARMAQLGIERSVSKKCGLPKFSGSKLSQQAWLVCWWLGFFNLC